MRSDLEEVQVRPGVAADLPVLTALHDHDVRETAVTCDTVAFTPEQRRPWLHSHPEDGPRRLLVAWTGDRMAGYATSSAYRTKPSRTTGRPGARVPGCSGHRALGALGALGSAELEGALREAHPVAVHRGAGRREVAGGLGRAQRDEQRGEVFRARVGEAARGDFVSKSSRASTSEAASASRPQASNSADQPGTPGPVCRRAARLCVKNPLPTISTPSSRSGASLRPMSMRRVGSRVGMDIWRTGTSASGNISTSGTYAPWSSPRSGMSWTGVPGVRSRARTEAARSGAPGASYRTP